VKTLNIDLKCRHLRESRRFEISVELASLQEFDIPVPREDVYNDHEFLNTLEES
jgi:hypothetical protein